MRTVLAICCLFAALFSAAQRPSPAPAQTRSLLVRGGTVHVGDGTVIDDGAVGFRDGRIDYVGYAYGVKGTYDTTIEASGKHVYPGLILADGTVGLHEIDQVRATADVNETGEMEPEVRTITAYNTDSRIIPTVRSNGVLIQQVVPRGATLSGSSSIVQFDAWNADEAVVRRDDGVHLNWTAAYERTGWWAERGTTRQRKEEERTDKLRELDRFLREAKAYSAVEPLEVDLRMEAMRGVFDGSRTLFVHAQVAREIQEAVLFAKDHGVPHLVIVGGYDAWRVADLLRDNKVDVILERIHSLPLREDDPIDLPYRLPVLLQEQNIRFCLGYTGDMERMGSRNLAFTAGTAAAYGLDPEAALQAITLDAARILRIDQHYGSLAVGKSATLFISTGDALDMRTNNVEKAFIDGRAIILDDHQKALYRQYKERYAR